MTLPTYLLTNTIIKYLINKFGNGCFTIDDFGEFSALLFGSYEYRFEDRSQRYYSSVCN